ncbi:hypothetical protein CKO28_17545 [Rhodovibrio sodomensis]|uniref:Uncharacterized protein n=1 Tax=Rhodovibrio sodomensis TaxID=1088 RepID=A0ABS1DK23_9PROT|nr:hypothetical protein [Rhodovibrio sodomensis]MBK1669843.1 hypothetical protein [Rhodovibrio sodomensis]
MRHFILSAGAARLLGRVLREAADEAATAMEGPFGPSPAHEIGAAVLEEAARAYSSAVPEGVSDCAEVHLVANRERRMAVHEVLAARLFEEPERTAADDRWREIEREADRLRPEHAAGRPMPGRPR